jgi:hypothetical protein
MNADGAEAHGLLFRQAIASPIVVGPTSSHTGSGKSFVAILKLSRPDRISRNFVRYGSRDHHRLHDDGNDLELAPKAPPVCNDAWPRG